MLRRLLGDDLQIHGSCISKCEHGIYMARPSEVKTGKAWYCRFCRPATDRREQKKLKWNKTVEANPVLTKAYGKGSCPKCGSSTHEVDGKFWICSDCSN